MRKWIVLILTTVLVASSDLTGAQQQRPSHIVTLPTPKDANVLPIEPLRAGLIPQAGDDDIVVIVGGEKVLRKQIRQLAGFFAASDPTLTSEEAFKRALVVVVEENAKHAEAVAHGVQASLESALKVRDNARQLCTPNTDCAVLVKAVTEARGITEEQYWEEAVPGYQRSLTTSDFMIRVIESGPGLKASGEKQSDFVLQWSEQLVKRTPIQWQDPELEQLYPEAVATFEPITRIVQGQGDSAP